MKIGKKNRVSSNILSYNIGLIGESGIGKTTLIYNVCEKIVGSDGYLFFECGKEDGQDAIEGLNYVSVVDWNSDYDEDNNTIGFKTAVEEIIDNKATEYKDLKTVVIDTYDELCLLAKDEVVRLHNKKNPDKRIDSIKAAFGGYMAGEDMAIKMILDSLWSLKKIGVNFIVIGHTKIREQQDLATGETYTQLTTNMTLRDFNAIKTKLHFLGVAYFDRNIAIEKSKKDSKKTVGSIVQEARKIVFRSDDFSVDSKSRFADITPEIPLNADDFIDALQMAITNAIEDNGKTTLKDREKEDKNKQKKREKEIQAAEKENKLKKELSEYLDQIKQYCIDNKSNKEILLKLAAESKQLGFSSPLEIDNIKDAKHLLEMCI